MSAARANPDPKLGGMPDRELFVAAARELVGSPFKHQGRVRAGIDCIGLLVVSARAVGLPIKDVRDYSRSPVPRELLAGLAANLWRVTRQEAPTSVERDERVLELAQPGDVVCVWGERPETPRHIGVRTDRGVIHTWNRGRKVVVEHVLDVWWREHAHSLWRFAWAQPQQR